MLNVWRIPLLFVVSGMGVYFALRKRNWKQLIGERSRRILVPFLFGMFCIVPIHMNLWQKYYKMDLSYQADPGHLWFLGNIFIYVLVLSPLLFYLRGHEEGRLVGVIRKTLSSPLGLIPVLAAFIVEVLIMKPRPFELYAMTWHGFVIGLLAFFFGFCFVLAGRGFWDMLLKWRWLFLAIALVLVTLRLAHFGINVPGYLLATESCAWIVSVFAFGHKYLNRSSPWLDYLSQAAYPVYILHMICLYLASWMIFPMDIAAPIKFVIVLVLTVAGCFALYEGIRRVNFLRPLFGLKSK
jgi:peptidoglycan/LPS O-acetylase OafA/YrhL